MNRRILALGCLTLAAGLSHASPAWAQSTELRMVLNWVYQGPQGWFFLAEDRGYFEEEGIDLIIDQGSGSGAAVPQVANGTYDVGFGDINALVELSATQDDAMPKAVFMLYNQPPFAIAVKAESDIETASDLEGRHLGGPANDGAFKLFPAFCDIAEIDCDGIEITNMQPNLREQMLMSEQVEGAFGYVNTLRFGAMAMGVDVDEELRFIRYGDFGMDLYSNAIIVSADLIENQPEVVEGLVRAINRGVKDALADPQAAIDAVAEREPLLDLDLELARFEATVTDEMSHPEIAEIGLGAVDMDRLSVAIDVLVDANELPRTPDAAEIFDSSFLPPLEDRLTSVDPD